MSLDQLFHKDVRLGVLLGKRLQCIWKNAPKETFVARTTLLGLN